MDNQLQVTPQSGFVSLSNMDEAFAFANMLSQSGMVPKIYTGKPADIVIAMQMGSEIGLKPLQSLQNIAVVNGRPTIWGDAVIAICQNSGLLEDITEVVTDTEATVTVTRSGQEPHSVTFSMEDAKKAGLANKAGPWTQYPKRMMKNRARAFALRDKFADVLSGFGITEEEKDRVLDVTPSRSGANVSSINSSINAALQTVTDKKIEYFDVTALSDEIFNTSNIEQINDIGEEIKSLVNNPAVNIKDEDLAELRQEFSDKKKQVVTATEYQNIMQQINGCQDLETAERLKSVIDDKASEFGDAVKSLYDKLEIVSEEIGAQG